MKKALSTAVLVAILAGCSTYDPYTGEQKTSSATKGTAIGALSGAAIGALAGGGEGALYGAAAGAAAGGGIGYYMDVQEAKLRQQLEGTGVRVQRDGDNLRLIMPGNITFATDSSEISSSFYSVLDSVATVLIEFDETSLDVTGYTDSTGNAQYNQTLSERRASSVASYLISRNIAPGRLLARGMGENNPIASNDTPAGRAQNRRVVLNIIPQQTAP